MSINYSDIKALPASEWLYSRFGRKVKAVKLTEKVAVHFKPGKNMKDRINATRDYCDIMEWFKNRFLQVIAGL